MLALNPITYEAYERNQKYMEVTLDYHGDAYTYYVPMNRDGSEPTEEDIDIFIQRYVDNPIPDGRDPIDFLATEELVNLDNPPQGCGIIDTSVLFPLV